MAARLLDSIGGRTSGCRLRRSGTSYQTQSMRYQHCYRSNTLEGTMLFPYFNNPLSISTVVIDSPYERTKVGQTQTSLISLYRDTPHISIFAMQGAITRLKNKIRVKTNLVLN